MYLTFDDAFTALAEESYYRELFNGTYTNPDGCAIRATHFISARDNNYALVNKHFGGGSQNILKILKLNSCIESKYQYFQVNKYFYMGHEVAAHSIT